MVQPDLQDKVIVITGAATGIGAAAATLFAKCGARLSLCDIDEQKGMLTAENIKRTGAEVIFTTVDVVNRHDVERLIGATVTRYGRVDCALNNAGIDGRQSQLHECTEENWDHVLDVNLKGIWLCMRCEITHMIEQKNGGKIVNVSSAAGLTGFALGLSAYVAAKHGVVGLTRAAALEYATKGIRINALCPGAVRTEMLREAIDHGIITLEDASALNPVLRLAEPVEIAEAAAWLCSERSSFVTGHALAVDGGLTAGVPSTSRAGS